MKSKLKPGAKAVVKASAKKATKPVAKKVATKKAAKKIAKPTPKPTAAVKRGLAEFFFRNGYTRIHDPERRQEENQGYKKGDEVRLMADSSRELATIRRLLRQAGFKLSRPFSKSKTSLQQCQPIYGRSEVARFLKLVAAEPGISGARQSE